MSDFLFILACIGVLIVLGGFIYTVKIGRFASTRQGELDTGVNENIQRHPYLLNPVFLSYIIGIGLIIMYLLYHISVYY